MSTKSLLRFIFCAAFLNLYACSRRGSNRLRHRTPTPPLRPRRRINRIAHRSLNLHHSLRPRSKRAPLEMLPPRARPQEPRRTGCFLHCPTFPLLRRGQGSATHREQKFKLVFRSSFDYVEYPWYGVLAALSQAENSEPGYGQGWEGYAKRYGSAFADGTIENMMVGAVFPSLFHQDPRFYQSSQGGFARRTGYAVSRIFVTRTDSGRSQFNYSEIFGSALSAAISTNTYHPWAFISTRFVPATDELICIHNASDRTLSNTASVWGTQLIYDTITIEIKEFWPDIHRKLSHKHESDAAPQTAGR